MRFPFRLSTKKGFVDVFKRSHERRIPMAKINFTWGKPYTLITYDLSDNNVSAQQIADNSAGLLHTTVSINGDSHVYALPNTTLCFSGSKADAERVFRQSFDRAKNPYFYSPCKISRLLITEVSNMSAYIED